VPARGCARMEDAWSLGNVRVVRRCPLLVLGISGCCAMWQVQSSPQLDQATQVRCRTSFSNLTQPVGEVQELPWVRVYVAALEHASAGRQVFGTTNSGPRGGSGARLKREVHVAT
jgi:hypothetical protein